MVGVQRKGVTLLFSCVLVAFFYDFTSRSRAIKAKREKTHHRMVGIVVKPRTATRFCYAFFFFFKTWCFRLSVSNGSVTSGRDRNRAHCASRQGEDISVSFYTSRINFSRITLILFPFSFGCCLGLTFMDWLPISVCLSMYHSNMALQSSFCHTGDCSLCFNKHTAIGFYK